MSCSDFSCACHPYAAAYLANPPSTCCEKCYIKPKIWVSAAHVPALLAEVVVTSESAYSASVFTAHLKVPSGLPPLTLSVAISQELYYAQGQEVVYHAIAKNLNEYWKGAPPAWVLEKLGAKFGFQPGGHAIVSVSSLGATLKKAIDAAAKPPSQYVNGGTVTRALRRSLPGLQAVVECPFSWEEYICECDLPSCSTPIPAGSCGLKDTVQTVVVHLNDHHRWDRLAIADWLETLDVDLTFPSEAPPESVVWDYGVHGPLLIVSGSARGGQEYMRRHRIPPNRARVVLSEYDVRGYRQRPYVIADDGPAYPSAAALSWLQAADCFEVEVEAPPSSYQALEQYSVMHNKMLEAIQYTLQSPPPQIVISDEMWKDVQAAAAIAWASKGEFTFKAPAKKSDHAPPLQPKDVLAELQEKIDDATNAFVMPDYLGMIGAPDGPKAVVKPSPLAYKKEQSKHFQKFVQPKNPFKKK